MRLSTKWFPKTGCGWLLGVLWTVWIVGAEPVQSPHRFQDRGQEPSQGLSEGPGQEPHSPIQWNAGREFFLLTGGLLANLGANWKLRNQPATEPSKANREALWLVDRWNAGAYDRSMAHLSDALVIPLTGAMPIFDLGMVVFGQSEWKQLWEDAGILAEALAWSSAFGLWVRSGRWHPRPLVFAPDAPWSERTAPEAGGSFYSGHTNSAFVGISVMATLLPARYPQVNPAWLWMGGGIAAAGVGILRMQAGKHYTSDVVVGAAMGTLFGWTFAKWHLKPVPKNSKQGLSHSLTLLPDGNGGARLAYRF
jgi:membrane-associated phospholipid phosphatase